MEVKLVIEPIFETDFCENCYGFRPQKSAHEAVDSISDSLHYRYTHVIDADLSKYFDTIPHAKLMAVVAERIVDGAILEILQNLAQSNGNRRRRERQTTHHRWRQRQPQRNPARWSHFSPTGEPLPAPTRSHLGKTRHRRALWRTISEIRR
jgi:retron-type reverse transcriptase